jgi:aminoglycoside phosphotransferase family enzyme
VLQRIIREGMEAAQDCHVDITLKDVQTIENEPRRLHEWVQIVREITDQYARTG